MRHIHVKKKPLNHDDVKFAASVESQVYVCHMIWPQPFSNSWWQANGDAAVDDDEDDVTMVVPMESEKPDGELAHLKAVSQSLDRDDVGVSENPVNWPNLYYNIFLKYIYLV